ncbi:hypothetical protein BC829DRAFT_227139 [Chytridium lagenaria]|nr:hypothetical protein BC829DRAFT_227139 [Chytridium lagenaria]
MSSGGFHGRRKGTSGNRDAEKIELYRELNRLMIERRSSGNFDEDSTKIVTKLLTLNPEHYTAWNYRRELILKDWNEKADEEIQATAVAELKFVESCIRDHPKSYWLWNHRRWILEHMPRPDWERELKLVNMMLEFDSRNFHGWDYRRYIKDKGNWSDVEAEVEYTRKKVFQNFSNFSAWHYRTKLLPRLAGDAFGKAIDKDFEVVRNAVFTEPSDQSAWMYQRWLLGETEGKAAQKLSCVWAKCFKHKSSFGVAFCWSKPVNIKDATLIASRGDQLLSVKRILCEKNSPQHVILFLVEVGDSENESRSYKFNCVLSSCGLKSDLKTQFGCTVPVEWSGVLDLKPEGDVAVKPSMDRTVVQRELKFILELLELEPESKWSLLTTAYLENKLNDDMKAVLGRLETLESVDLLRTGYYKDLASDVLWQIESTSSIKEGTILSLSNKGLTRISSPFAHPHITSIDLSNNILTKIPLFTFITDLNLDNNRIASIFGLEHLPLINTLSLRDNLISTVEGISNLSSASSQLFTIRLHGNPFKDINVIKNAICEICPSIAQIDI